MLLFLGTLLTAFFLNTQGGNKRSATTPKELGRTYWLTYLINSKFEAVCCC
jgi:hypothetical protein